MILQSETSVSLPTEADTADKNTFRQEVLEGLTKTPKALQSKYFYDAAGDVLFQQIMALPEYYLTRCELDIFRNQTGALADFVTKGGKPFDLIELGAGDATKSSYLLQYLAEKEAVFTYMPIDISGNILSVLNNKLNADIPGIDIVGLEGEYFDMLRKATSISSRRKVVLFLGGNIGNMEKEEAVAFCRGLRGYLNPGDSVVIGFDLKKHPQTIFQAYNDKQGITAAFNLNLLTRINRELDANFNLNKFEHYQNYDPLTGACRSYLVSLLAQNVTVADTIISFKKEEVIYMEVSQKFSQDDISALAHHTGFAIIGMVNDSKNWFTNALWVAQ